MLSPLANSSRPLNQRESPIGDNGVDVNDVGYSTIPIGSVKEAGKRASISGDHRGTEKRAFGRIAG